jgi:lipoic acid synthetase
MRPTKKHMKVERYVEPAEFAQWKKVAEEMGFLYVAAGPLVRSSYKAGEFFIEGVLKKRREEARVKELAAYQLSPEVKSAAAESLGLDLNAPAPTSA